MGHLHISTVLLLQPTLSSCALQLEKGRACLFCQLAILVFILPVMHSSLFTLSLTRSLSCPLAKLYLSGRLSAPCPLLRLLLFSSAYLLPSLVVATFQQLFCCHLCSCSYLSVSSAAVSAAAAGRSQLVLLWWCLVLARVLDRPGARVTKSLLLGSVAQLLQLWYLTRQYLVLVNNNFDTSPAGTKYLVGLVAQLLKYW